MVGGWDRQLDHRDLTWIVICLVVSFFGLLIRALTIGFTPAGTSGRNTKEGQVAKNPLYSLFNTFLNENGTPEGLKFVHLGKNGGAVSDHFK